MSLQEEKRMVYTMLSEGRITVEEAEALVILLEESISYHGEPHVEEFKVQLQTWEDLS